MEDGIVAGTGGLTKTGAGRLTLGAPGTYGGGTFLDGGTLELGRIDAAGTGAITFGAGAQTLALDTAGPLANRIAGFGPGDTIALTTLSGTQARMSYAGDSLRVTDGTRTTSFAIAAPAIGTSFALGTDVNAGAALGLAPAWVNGQITISAANQNALGDIVFTGASETLLVDSAAWQDEPALSADQSAGAGHIRLPPRQRSAGGGGSLPAGRWMFASQASGPAGSSGDVALRMRGVPASRLTKGMSLTWQRSTAAAPIVGEPDLASEAPCST